MYDPNKKELLRRIEIESSVYRTESFFIGTGIAQHWQSAGGERGQEWAAGSITIDVRSTGFIINVVVVVVVDSTWLGLVPFHRRTLLPAVRDRSPAASPPLPACIMSSRSLRAPLFLPVSHSLSFCRSYETKTEHSPESAS